MLQVLKARIVSLCCIGEAAKQQALKLDSSFEGELISAVVVKEDNGNPREENGEFEVRYYDEHDIAVTHLIEDHKFEVVSVNRDTDDLVAA